MRYDADRRVIETELIDAALHSMDMDSDSGGIQGIFRFSDDFPMFSGQSGDRVEFPAIVQVVAVRILAARGLGKKLLPLALHGTRFNGMIRPGDEVTVRVRPSRGDERIRLAFCLESRGCELATGELQCMVEE